MNLFSLKGRLERRVFITGSRFVPLFPMPTGRYDEKLRVVKSRNINFYVFVDGGETICFDAGFDEKTIKRELRKVGIAADDVTRIFLTHSDYDHAGGVPAFRYAKLYLSEIEAAMIEEGKKRLFGFSNSRLDREGLPLRDGQVLEFGSTRIECIATPGHTPGSMSYLVNGAFLFVGDTFKIVDGKVRTLRNYINMDTELQADSIRKLAKLENVRAAFTAHFGWTERFSEATKEWREP